MAFVNEKVKRKPSKSRQNNKAMSTSTAPGTVDGPAWPSMNGVTVEKKT